MLIPKTPHYCTILISFAMFLIYFAPFNIPESGNFPKNRNHFPAVKKVVAYSVLKRVEIEGRRYDCEQPLENNGEDNLVNGSDKKYYRNRNSRRENGEDAWRKIEGLYVSSVNLDKRLEPYHYIRIVGMVKGDWTRTIYCQMPHWNNTYQIRKATITPIWSKKWSENDTNIYFNPVLLSCSLPFGILPKSVSLTTTTCQSINEKNTFRIVKNGGTQTFFTVCVKPLQFLEDIHERLMQWIEIIRILGAERIEIYAGKVTQNVWQVLKWYNNTYASEIVLRRFNIINETLRPAVVGETFLYKIWQRRRYEVVAYNNCFYRNMETSKFVVPLDIDEIIVPRNWKTWRIFFDNMFSSSQVLEEKFASFSVPNAYYFRKFDEFRNNEAFFLKNLNRSHFSPPRESGKSFVSTKNALSVFNHYALGVLRPGVGRTYFLSSSVIQLNHYRETCDFIILPECVMYLSTPTVVDDIILKYKKQFLNRYNTSLVNIKKLGIL